MAKDSFAVRQDRIERTQQSLGAAGLDGMILGPGADLFYLTGFDAHLSERMNLLVVPAEGTPVLVVPQLEAPLVGPAGEYIPVETWADGEDPAAIAASVLREGAGQRIAVGNQLWSAFLLRIQKHAGDFSWREATPVMRTLRMRKDESEIANLAEAGRRTDEAWEAFIEGPGISGLTEREALGQLVNLTTERGVRDMWGICASGPNSASPHHATGDRVIQDGDAVIFDWGGKVNGYFSDVTRTVHIGEPGDEFRTVYEIVLRANQATLDTVRPGLPLQDLDRVARDLITKAGYGPAFIHRVGHGLGLEVHEEPYLVEGNDLPLETGMVFSDEPGIYLEGRFGIRIEDSVVCLEDRGRRLNEATRDLVIMS